uniref:AlNc14C1G48 protein n=1 Tax=Albugo laibachii Nc14 TaxID=890382 RepID=F0VYP6_9STRA|nr:AlNc14C1G48 [Albugo laibachii Nc14]|eukprot:CCA13910.1 AlNc14C1G48 [Albugo laibachii Nc14]
MRFRSSKWIVFISLKLLKTFTLSIDCKENERPVSVLNTTTVYCIDHTACSGTYGSSVIGSCPQPAECAIIPHSVNVMGCVLPRVPGITYIRPDGTIYTTDGSPPSIIPIPTLTGNENNRNGVEKQSIPLTQNGPNEGSNEDRSNKVVDTTEDTEKDSLLRKKVVMPESSSTSALNNSNTSNKKTGAASVSVVVICVLVVIGLSIAAVVAGVRLLRNKKNAAGAAEAEAEDQNFGFGCVTPKDEVVLL